jgi:hypothetical protein
MPAQDSHSDIGDRSRTRCHVQSDHVSGISSSVRNDGTAVSGSANRCA